MNNADVGEMMLIALAARDEGYKWIQVDPADFIEVAIHRAELLEALEDVLEAEGVLSFAVAQRKARLAIAKAKGEGK